MKFSFLGTSHGVPAADRFTSCYLLEAGGNLYVFDAGGPVVNLLLRKDKDLTKVKAFFCSHFHGDHMDGGISMLTLFDWYYKETSLDAYLPDDLTEKAIRFYAEACDDVTFADGRIRLHVTQPGVIYDDGILRVTAIPVAHIIRPDKRSYAFLMEAEGKKVLYTGDLSYGMKRNDFPEVAFTGHYSLILSEGAHFPVEMLAGCMDKVDTEVFAVSHVFPLEKYDQLRALQSRYPFRILLPDDGDEIEL